MSRSGAINYRLWPCERARVRVCDQENCPVSRRGDQSYAIIESASRSAIIWTGLYREMPHDPPNPTWTFLVGRTEFGPVRGPSCRPESLDNARHRTLLMRQIQPSSVTDIARIYCKTEDCLVCAQRPHRRSYCSISSECYRIRSL